MVSDRELDVAGVGNPVGQEAPVGDVEHPVALRVDHQGRREDLGEMFACVEAQDAFDLALDVRRARRLTLESSDPAHEGDVVALARHHPVDHVAGIDAPRPRQLLELFKSLAGLVRRVAVLRVVRQVPEGGESGRRVHEHELLDSLGVASREQLRHDAALREPDQARALDAGSIHDRGDVPDALLERRLLFEAVRHPDAALVEHEHPRVVRVEFEDTPVQLVVPAQLHVGHEWWDHHEIGARAELLIGDMEPVRQGVQGVGWLHGRIMAVGPGLRRPGDDGSVRRHQRQPPGGGVMAVHRGRSYDVGFGLLTLQRS